MKEFRSDTEAACRIRKCLEVSLSIRGVEVDTTMKETMQMFYNLHNTRKEGVKINRKT